MSRSARIAIIAAAAVTAVIAFVALRPGEVEDAEQPERDSIPAAKSGGKGEGTNADAGKPKAKPKPRITTIRVRGGEPVGGVKKISASAGEMVRFRATSDVADEVHLHGYDVSKEIGPGEPVEFRFKADLEGVFEVELEQRAVPIATLTVQP